MKIIQLSVFFKSLSEPVRLRILNLLLQKGELCVCDITSTLELPQSVISRHLAYLKKHTLVSSRRQGNWQYYESTLLTPEHEFHFMANNLKEAFDRNSSCHKDIKRLAEIRTTCCEKENA